MHLRQYLLTQRGANEPFAFVTPPFDTNTPDYFDRVEELIIAEFRHDREVGRSPGPGKNPSLPTSEVKYYFTPSMARQQLYRQSFPISCFTHMIVDAFVCLGSRFGLDQIQCYVEVCRSDFGQKRWWANVYYVADSVMPACIVETTQLDSQLDDDYAQSLIGESRAREARFRTRDIADGISVDTET